MGLYGDLVVPRIVDVVCGMKMSDPLRRRVCDGLKGGVVELGFGSGHNISFYPASVTAPKPIGAMSLGTALAPYGSRVH